MARTAITPRTMTKNAGLDMTTGGTTIDAALVTAGAVINSAQPERIVLYVTNTEGTTNVVTINAGDNPPALRAGQGNLTITVAATTGVQTFGPFESDKILQSDGTMEIDFETGMTGVIHALLLPKV